MTTGANTFNAYKCLKTHTSSDSIPVTNTTYWQKFNSLVPVYTPLIMAQNAILRFMQGNQLLIMKGDNKTVAAGLVGGDYPLWVGATTPTDAPYKVSIAGKLYAAGAVISGDSTFEGTLKGVSGSFTRLNCVNAAGDAVGGISFGSDGRMWFDGDMYHQGTKDNRSLRFYTSDLWCRGVFGARERSIMVVYGSYAYVYTKGADKTGTYIPLTSGTSSANETYYTVPCYSPRYDYNGETSGFPVDTVIFRITSNVTYRYLLSLAVTQRIFVVNANDNYNNVQIYANGTKQTLNGGSMHHCMQLVDFMYPSPNSDWLGRGLMFGASMIMIGSDYERINFERIEIFVDIDKTRCSVENYKKDFANIIYQLGRGIEAHALAFKIFNSNGEIEYNDEECNMIKEYASLCSPAFIDAINKLLLE